MRRSEGGQGWVGDEYQSRAHSTIPPTTLWRGVVRARGFQMSELEGVAANDYRQARPTPELPCSERLMDLWLWGGQAPHWNAYAKSQLRYILSGVACNKIITP